ncbi:ABC transporter ATP-binding protein [Vagococcus salmoninarum]|uniref:ABC transporter ATP-binding protein n=1 Tax=Vagococcus salmoninarum TaxID=2739 RepID=UPI0028D559DF|nr:ABC transporter ATP-binding protein [Vagococcus salmoninarum]
MSLKHKDMSITRVRYLIFRTTSLLYTINKKYLISIIFFTLIISVFPSINVIALRELTNAIQNFPNSRYTLIQYILFYFTISILSLFVTKINEFLTFCFANRISYHMNIQILEKTSELSLTDFENADTYNKIQRADSQSDEVLFDYFFNFLSLIGSFITVITSLFILIFWKWWLAFLIIIISILRSIIMIHFGREKFKIHTNRTSSERKKWYYSYLLKNDLSFKEIKIYQLHQYFLSMYKDIFNDFFSQDKFIQKKMILFDFLLSFINAMIQIVLVFLGSYDAATRKILIGDTISFIQSGNNVRNGADSFMTTLSVIVTSSMYLEQLFDFLDLETDIQVKAKKIQFKEPIETIEFKNVNFKYGLSDVYALNNINFTFNTGCRYSIVGRNGSGKTTLTKLMLGLYTNYSGTIKVNGIDLKEIDLASYWEKVGVLFQDYTKYEMTLKENIIFKNDISKNKDAKINKLLDTLDSSFFSTLLLSQQLGFWFDNGLQLSGGQWIKIAISRALIREPSLLILDEPNASLDNLAESNLMEIIKKSTQNRISLIITHRLKSLHALDAKVIFMFEGTINGEGTVNQLLNTNLYFKELYDAEK